VLFLRKARRGEAQGSVRINRQGNRYRRRHSGGQSQKAISVDARVANETRFNVAPATGGQERGATESLARD